MAKKILILIISFICINLYINAQVESAPLIKEGKGPFNRLILRGLTLINSTGLRPMAL